MQSIQPFGTPIFVKTLQPERGSDPLPLPPLYRGGRMGLRKLRLGSTRRQPSGAADYFDNVMTKFIVNNRTEALKTDVNLFFTIINCLLSLADPSHEF